MRKIYLLVFLVLLGIAWYFYLEAIKDRSFYTMLIAALYSYIGAGYVMLNFIDRMSGFGIGSLYLVMIYFIASAVGMTLFLIKTNNKIKTNDRI